MKNLKMENFVWAFLIVSVLAWVCILAMSGVKLELSWEAMKVLPDVVTVDLLVWGFFVKWGWKWKIFQDWLVPFPVLEGTWQGTFKSTWINPETNAALGESPMVLVIKQTFTNVCCTIHTHTQESSSQSYAASFLLDEESDARKLVYAYTNRPKAGVRHRSAVHDGTALLRVIDNPKRMLEGEYWTNRKTTGDIQLTFRSKELLETFPDDLKPVEVGKLA